MKPKKSKGLGKFFVLVAFFAAVVFTAGCGTEMTVVNVKELPNPEPVTPSPSDTNSAGLLSGFVVSIGGDHYRTVMSVGGSMSKPVQSSGDGKYEIK